MRKLLHYLLVTASIVPLSSVNSFSLAAFGQQSSSGQDSIRHGSLKSLIFTNTIPVNKANTPVNTPEQLFAGRVAGVQVMETNGGPGGEFAVTIRGVTTLARTSEPLYVIDGIPLELSNNAFAVSRTGLDEPTYALNALSMIDPAEIESIQVLKDISAIAIYGTRASNGVVLITTKKSLNKNLKIRFESSASVQKMTRKVKVLNSTDFMRLSRERLADYPDDFSAAKFLTAAPESYENVDWMDEVTRTGHIFRNNLTVSGGVGPVRLLVQGGLFKHNGIVKESAFDRKNVGVNLDTDLWKNRIKLGTRLYYADAGGDQRSVKQVQTGIPIGPVYNPDGSPFHHMFGSYQAVNPLDLVMRSQVDSQHKRLLSTTHAEISILKNLSIRSTYGISKSWNDYQPNGISTDSNFQAYYKNSKTYFVDARVHFSQPGKRFRYELEAGYSQFTDFGNYGQARGSRSAVNVLLNTLKSADYFGFNSLPKGISQAIWTKPRDRVNSVFLQAKLGLGNAFEVQLTSRQDLNKQVDLEKFKRGNASSVGIAWQVNKPGVPVSAIIGTLRFHADYGYIAQSYLTLPPLTATYNYLRGEYRLQGSIGADMSLLSDRLQIGIDYFDRQTHQTPFLTVTIGQNGSGYRPIYVPIDRLVARGVELTTSYEAVRSSDWRWTLTGNAAYMSNNIRDDRNAGIPSDIGGSGKSGPVGAWYRYRNLGVWHNAQEISQEYKGPTDRTPKPGDSRYTDDKEVVYAGTANPKLIWGLTSEMTWKQWDFSLLIRGEHGQKVQNEMAKQLYDLRFVGNISQEVYENAWTPAHPERNFPALTNGGGDIRNSDWFLQKTSFVRLQNISVGYTYPFTAGNRSLRVYLNGQNLFLLTPYKGWDPEVNKYGQHPHYRGVDEGIYPRARTFTLGIQFNL